LLIKAQPKNALANPPPPNLEMNANIYERKTEPEALARDVKFFTIFQCLHAQFYSFCTSQFYNFQA
jgi:hypothetical protein